MLDKLNVAQSKIAVSPESHRRIRIIAGCVKVIAFLIFISPYILRMTDNASINEFFHLTLGSMGVSLFLMLAAELSVALIEPGRFDG
ncbi:hypothetical protein IFO69_04270 [Echinicola sp. CAU 1574]|uniref:Uncharacterized protein n=1 Tax=Echinicola arenosa TaxID=2774144 RepID=A0ABR9AGS0_9BACT|nr:hypothetical protein [Echinicola arenosa]MBD8487957.1 hypothetical protein [Echinicola arenosa]